MLMLAIFAVILLIFGGILLRLLAKIFFGALSLTLSAATFIFKLFCIFFGLLAGVIFLILQKILPIASKYLLTAATWIISAIVTVGLLIYATGRKFFCSESITEFVEKLIPQAKHSRSKDFSLLLIELADSIHFDISSRLETQYAKVLKFFNPVKED